jgi:LmbE family N-acetylglucosaminyl deacetylase
VNSKENFRWLIGLIRDVRPDAIFTHGPHGRHRDHRATHELTVEATWQAGQPVNSDLGPPYRTPHLYYDKEVTGGLPEIAFDVTGFRHKELEALATQASQMAVFGRKVEDLLKEAAEDVRSPRPAHDRFWIAPGNRLQGFLPEGL